MNSKLPSAAQVLPAPELVYNHRSFGKMMNHLSRQSLLALDTESDSLYRYFPRVCLIQISAFSTPDTTDPNDVVDYLIDPFRLDELESLGLLFADPNVEVILHAAENDMLTLQHDYSFTFNRIFDTQLACRILGWTKVGLAAILESEFGIVSDKRMQRTNWGGRPLTPQQITYAQMDTHFLPALRQRLIEELETSQRWIEAQEAFEALARVDYRHHTPPERSFWTMKTTREVPRTHTGLLEALWQWREHEAQRQNRPPFKIMGDHVLAALAVQQPQALDDLTHVQGLSKNQLQRYGPELLQVIEEGSQRPLPPLPESEVRPEQLLPRPVRMRYAALRSWRTDAASRRGVGPEIVLSNDILLKIAEKAPRSATELETIAEIGPWKAQTYGPEILRVVSEN